MAAGSRAAPTQAVKNLRGTIERSSLKFDRRSTCNSLRHRKCSNVHTYGQKPQNIIPRTSPVVQKLPALSHPPGNKLWTLCSALTDYTASVARAHKWTNGSAVTPFTASHWLGWFRTQAMLGIVVLADFDFKQWTVIMSSVKIWLNVRVYSYNSSRYIGSSLLGKGL